MKIAPNPQLDMFAATMTQLGSLVSEKYSYPKADGLLYPNSPDTSIRDKHVQKESAVCYVSLGMLANDNTDYYCLNKTTTF